MQSVSTKLRNILAASTKDLVTVVEIYKETALPGANGFDPASTDLLLAFAKVENITYRAQVYSKYLTQTGAVRRTIKKKLSTFSFTLDNSDRAMKTFEDEIGFEGKIVVVRDISRTESTELNDSIVLFTGVCKRPSGLKKASETISIDCEQTLNQTDKKLPRRNYTTEDAEARAQSDPEFEGFIFDQRSGQSYYQETEKQRFLLFFSKNKTVTRTLPWSSGTNINAETPVALVLGRSQVEAVHLAFADKGTWLEGTSAFCDGYEHGIKNYENIRSVTPGFPLPSLAAKYGRRGSYIDSDTTQTNDHPGWLGAAIYSRTANVRWVAVGSQANVSDSAPQIVAVILGLILPAWDGSSFSGKDWTDSGAIQARWLLTSGYVFGLAGAWIDDADILKTVDYCNQVLVDQTNSETVILPESEQGLAGNAYHNYVSTAVLSPQYYRDEGGYLIEPLYKFYQDLPYNSDDPFGLGTPSLPATLYRRRYTSNILLKEQMGALDFLFDVVLPAFNGYLIQRANGKFTVRTKKPVDFTFVAAQSAVGANLIEVLSIEAWRYETGQILIGANTPTSEVRTVTGARYKSVNIPLTASGGISASGNIAGGDSNNAPSATITVTSLTGQKVIGLDTYTLRYNPQPLESLDTCASFIAAQINSHPVLTRYVGAQADGTVVTIKSKIGYLDLNSNLSNAHKTAISSPASAPNLTPIVGGNLPPGRYQICYSYQTIEGETLTSPVSEIYLAQAGKIQTPSLVMPSRVTAIHWYVSVEAGGVRRRRVRTNFGASFNIDSLPRLDEKSEPVLNASGEEIHRVALAFADKANSQNALAGSNVLKGTFEIRYGDSSTVNQVEGNYIDASQDFKKTKFIVNDRAKQRKVRKVNSKKIDLTACDSYNQARRLLNQALALESDGDVFTSVSSEGLALLLEEFDPLAITDESGRYINEPVVVEELTYRDDDGYPTVEISARRYRRYFFDDQCDEKLVPIPVVQNVEINKEQNAPTLFIKSVSNTEIVVGVKNYTPAATHRLIQWAADADFETNLKERVEAAQNALAGNILKDEFAISRSTNLANAQTVYIRVAHSTNAETYGEFAIKSATYPSSGGGGGTTPEPPPPTVFCAALSPLSYGATVTGTIANNGGTGTIRVFRNFNGGSYGQIQALAAQSQSFSDNPSVSGTYNYYLIQDGAAGQSETRPVTVNIPEQPPIQPPLITSIAYDSANQRAVVYFTERGGSANFTVDRNVGQGWVRHFDNSIAASATSFPDQDGETAQTPFTKAIGYRIARHNETGFSNEEWVEIPALPPSSQPPVLSYAYVSSDFGSNATVSGSVDGNSSAEVYYDDSAYGSGLYAASLGSGINSFEFQVPKTQFNRFIYVYATNNVGQGNVLQVEIPGTGEIV